MLQNLSIDQKLRKISSHLKKYEFNEAEILYLDILKTFPKNIKAKEGLKTLKKNLQNPSKQVVDQLINYLNKNNYYDLFKEGESLLIKYPDAFMVYNILGLALHNLKKCDDALLMFNKALTIEPRYAVAYYNIGNILQSENKLNKAINFYDKAISLDSTNSNAFHKKGIALFKLGKLDQAIEVYKKCILLTPNYAEAHNNMGICLYYQNKLKDSIISYNKSLSINPEYANALYNKSVALFDLGELEQAINVCKKSIFLKSDYAEAHHKMGDFLQHKGLINEAIEAYNKALSINPNYINSYNNIGSAYLEQGRFEKAIEIFKKGISLSPEQPEIYHNLSFGLLASGKIKEGLEAYEWRKKTEKFLSNKREFSKPEWDGKESLKGKKILVWSEQGIGETIRWSSRLPLLSTKAEKCILECQDKLVPLLKRSFPNIEIKAENRDLDSQRNDFDFHLPMGSLYRCVLDEIINSTKPNSYLIPDPNRVIYWKNRLSSLGNGPYVGITWKSSLLNSLRNKNYSSISEWGPILRIPNITFINLQYKNYEDDLVKVKNEFGIEIHNFKDLDQYENIDDTSALYAALDVVISHNHSPHLISSAVGTPTKLANWRQNTNNNSFLFAPGGSRVDTFEKDTSETWENVFGQIAKDLLNLK